MVAMTRMFVATLAAAGFTIVASACSAPAKDDSSDNPAADPGASGSGAGGASAGAGADPGAGAGGANTPAAGTTGAAAGSGAMPANPNGTPPPPPTTPPPIPEELDKSVDWTALKLIYPTAFTAFDGEHQFKVPFYVDGATVELAGWSSIPSDAVTFDADPDGGMGGVIATVVKDVPEITIAARSDTIGGVALLNVTSATPEQWAAGEARYNNGKELDLMTMIDPAMFAQLLLDPNWKPPSPPGDIACSNCHGLGAKLLEVQHTPTQAARFSDDQLRAILTTGVKPDGVGLRVLPEMLFNMTGAEVYKEFHTWDSTEEEIVGLIVYMRSLTPTGQGDILLPDGTYAPPGMLPMMP